MTGEHKIGVAVTCTFLCLTGAVIGLKMQNQPVAKTSSGTEADAPPSPLKAPPQPARGLITNKDVAEKATPTVSPPTPSPTEKEKKRDEIPLFNPGTVPVKVASASSTDGKSAAKEGASKPLSSGPEIPLTPPTPVAKANEQKNQGGEKDRKPNIKKPYSLFPESDPTSTSTKSPKDTNAVQPAGEVLPSLLPGATPSASGPVRPPDKPVPAATKTGPKDAKPSSPEPAPVLMTPDTLASKKPAKPETTATAPPSPVGIGPFMASTPPPAPVAPPSATSSIGTPPLVQPVKPPSGDTTPPPALKADLPNNTNTFERIKPASPLTPPAPLTGNKLEEAKPAAVAPVPVAPSAPVKPPTNSYFVPEASSSANPGTGARSTGTAPAPLPYPTLPVSTPNKPSAAAPRPAPQVIVYDEQDYVCQPGDTFEKISARFYQSEAFAQALRRHNRHHARASLLMANVGTITPGEKIFIPPADILEQRYGDAVVKPASPTATQTLPASFSAPAGASPNP